MSEVAPEVVDRMVAFIRYLASATSASPIFREAAEIAALLPEPVDPDLIEAREIVAAAVAYGAGIPAELERKRPAEFLEGACDGGSLIQRAVLAIKRGRELAAQP